MRPRLRPGLVRVDLPGDELVVQNQETAEAVVLNSVGAAVLELCDGRSSDEIVEFITAHVAGAERETVSADVATLLSQLLAAGLIEDASE